MLIFAKSLIVSWVCLFVLREVHGLVEEKEKSPHIVLIVADDLGWNDVDWHDPTLDTPNLNFLAHSQHSVRLHHAYVNQVCSP